MKKENNDTKLEFRRLGVLMESMNDKIDLVVEQYGDIKKTLDQHTDMMGNLMVDVSIVKEDIEFIKHGPKKKVDLDEFVALEKRVMLLEKKAK
jgi:hypothetical protein